MIKEGEAVADLVIEDPVRLWSQVPEQYAGDVRVGQMVRVSTRAHPEITFHGKITRINPVGRSHQPYVPGRDRRTQ